MKTVFLSKFLKDLDKISQKKVKTEIVATIENVEEAKTPDDIKNLKKLKGSKIAYRIRIGDYRLGLFIQDDTVEFARVANRKDIYKLFP